MRIRPIVLIPSLVSVHGVSLAVLHSQQRSHVPIGDRGRLQSASSSPPKADPVQRRYPRCPHGPDRTATLLAEVEQLFAIRPPHRNSCLTLATNSRSSIGCCPPIFPAHSWFLLLCPSAGEVWLNGIWQRRVPA